MSIPDYENGQYYVFDDAYTAQRALDFVNNCGVFPIASHNADGEHIDGTAAICWVDAIRETVGGKFVFPRVDPERMAACGVDCSAMSNVFHGTFGPDIVMRQKNWFPDLEDE